MSEYQLSKGSIETNKDGEVVGASIGYFHLIGEDISDVIRRKEARGIRKSADETHTTGRLPAVQRKSGFKRYRSSLLRERQSTSR